MEVLERDLEAAERLWVQETRDDRGEERRAEKDGAAKRHRRVRQAGPRLDRLHPEVAAEDHEAVREAVVQVHPREKDERRPEEDSL